MGLEKSSLTSAWQKIWGAGRQPDENEAAVCSDGQESECLLAYIRNSVAWKTKAGIVPLYLARLHFEYCGRTWATHYKKDVEFFQVDAKKSNKVGWRD